MYSIHDSRHLSEGKWLRVAAEGEKLQEKEEIPWQRLVCQTFRSFGAGISIGHVRISVRAFLADRE